MTDPVFSDDEATAAPLRRRAALGWVAVVLALVWVAALLWMARGDLAAMPPLALAQFGAAAAMVPALAGIVWLLALRTSDAEARRFGATARAMRAESQALESAVAALGDEIEARRTALAEQVRLLTALGEAATARLATIGEDLSGEIARADAHARALSNVTDHAHEQLDALLAALPRATDETRTLATTIDQAGLVAYEHSAALDAQVAALAARGREAETVAGGAAEKLAAYMQRMEATSATAGARLEAVTSDAAVAVDALLDRTASAIDESRKGIVAQGEAMLAMVNAGQQALDHAARGSAEALGERIALVEVVIERIAARLDSQRGAGEMLFSTLDDAIDQAAARFETLHRQGTERSRELAATISALQASTEALTAAMDHGNGSAERTIVTTENLLVALDAAAREMDETMPDAIARLESRVGSTKQVIVAAKPELLALVTAAESTHDAIEAVAQVVAEQRQTVETLTTRLSEGLERGRAQAGLIGDAVEDVTRRADDLAEEAAPRLLEALLRVRETAAAAADHAREALARVIPEAADALESAGVAALERAVESGVQRQVQQVARLSETAVVAANRAGERLQVQLEGIEATIALIDQRLEEAREAGEENERDTFARRASLLIESLNSASIDLTRTFAPEISDSAWAAYLKGDRGVFTRRAVRLLDGSEQRDVARLYDDDAGFREQVNRYIHDFEAMLRTILAQRDGSPLGVTLLSSDMGKLYVALAQAIERLR
ncbi:putative nucleic acid-binding Zn-ribbon protein [Sphingomonas sp. BE138]|uniref:hypothetical protein n=1 Tax=Sphingomonas sp. BE138 TaxID=2817845 RepID=UPI002857A8B0|nr:hypothetical protein [Sphingomonas sp. BE138]MDR6786764.1 putative nucleic acid-binding Zn-ribbon protein [Sphingomonas sp. BE138]